MTEIEKKALALVNEITAERNEIPYYEISRDELSIVEALCRAIEQHEAFKQEVSDAVELSIDRSGHDGLRAGHINEYLGRFIIPKPTVDPLIEALTKAGWGMPETNAKELRAALGAVGFKIVETER